MEQEPFDKSEEYRISLATDHLARLLLRTDLPKEVIKIPLPDGEIEGVVIKSDLRDIVVTKSFIATTTDDGAHLDKILPRRRIF